MPSSDTEAVVSGVHRRVLDEEALSSILPALDKAASDRAFVDILLGSGNPRMVRLAIDRYRDQLGIGGLINLLDNGDPSVRISAVRALKDVNEIAILKVKLWVALRKGRHERRKFLIQDCRSGEFGTGEMGDRHGESCSGRW